MLTVEYSGRNFDSAWDAIDRGEALDVVVRGWRVPILRRSLPLCAVFFGRERRLNHHRPTKILHWALRLVQPVVARDLQPRDDCWDDGTVARDRRGDHRVVQAALTVTASGRALLGRAGSTHRGTRHSGRRGSGFRRARLQERRQAAVQWIVPPVRACLRFVLSLARCRSSA